MNEQQTYEAQTDFVNPVYTFNHDAWDTKLAYVADYGNQVADLFLAMMENIPPDTDRRIVPYEMVYMGAQFAGIVLEQASGYIEQLEREIARLTSDVSASSVQPADQVEVE